LDAFQKIADAATNTKGKRETFPLFFVVLGPFWEMGEPETMFT
jgi:hypothetical protein